MKVLGIAGSLRRGSYNRAALRAAQALVPADTKLDIFELDGIPGFNQDDEQHPPAKVVELKAKVRAAVERRLAQAKIAVENGSGPELLVSVSADRNRAETGACEFGRFSVTVGLRELVTLERAPEQGPVAVIT